MAEPRPGLMILLGHPEPMPHGRGMAEGGEAGDDDKDAALESCAEDLISAVHSKDAKGVAEELRYIFDLLESEPHEEGGEEEEEASAQEE